MLVALSHQVSCSFLAFTVPFGVVTQMSWTNRLHSRIYACCREQGLLIIQQLPAVAQLGLFRVDCHALQQRLAERAYLLAETVLLTVQHDAEELSKAIIGQLQVWGQAELCAGMGMLPILVGWWGGDGWHSNLNCKIPCFSSIQCGTGLEPCAHPVGMMTLRCAV